MVKPKHNMYIVLLLLFFDNFEFVMQRQNLFQSSDQRDEDGGAPTTDSAEREEEEQVTSQSGSAEGMEDLTASTSQTPKASSSAESRFAEVFGADAADDEKDEVVLTPRGSHKPRQYLPASGKRYFAYCLLYSFCDR